MKRPIREGLLHMPGSDLDKPYLLGSRCSVCGYTSFPRKDVCVRCLRDDTMEEARFGPLATLDSFAVMQVAPPGFTPPYIQGYVTLKPEGPKVFTLITGCDPTEGALELGEAMELVVDKIKDDEDGNELMGWKFKPVRKKG